MSKRRTRRKPEPNILLVEGDQDTRIIPYFMEANGVSWDEPPPVYIDSCDGFENIVAEGVLKTEFKATGLKAIGIIADANSNVEKRWQSLRDRCKTGFPNLPNDLPHTGLVCENVEEIRLGIWIMPDNQNHGMMETFLANLAQENNNPLWNHAVAACTEAKKHNAPYTDAHTVKANLHTWLAWQKNPGLQLHTAVVAETLDPKSPYAANFVKWFRELFEV